MHVKIDSFLRQKRAMINAAIINSAINNAKYEYVDIFDTYALIYNYPTRRIWVHGTAYNKYTYVSDTVVDYDCLLRETSYRKNFPEYIFTLFLNMWDNIDDYGIPLAKKWTPEYKIAKIIYHSSKLLRGKIIISDTYVMIKDGDNYICYSNKSKHFLATDSNKMYTCKAAIFDSCIVNGLSSGTWNGEMMCIPIIIPIDSILLDRSTMDLEYIYSKITNARARGLRHISAFSDIIICNVNEN